MSLSQTSSTLVVVWYIVGSVLGTAGLLALAVLLQRIQARLDHLEQILLPRLERVDQLISDAETRVGQAGDTTERILANAESVATNLETASHSTTRLVRKAIHYPLVEINAVAYGFMAAIANMARGGTRQNERKIP